MDKSIFHSIETVGIRVNPHVYYGNKSLKSGQYPLICYFHFSIDNEQLLSSIYNYFGVEKAIASTTNEGQAFLEPSINEHTQTVAHEIYFANAQALEHCFHSILLDYELIDAYTNDWITIKSLVNRARTIEKAFSRLALFSKN